MQDKEEALVIGHWSLVIGHWRGTRLHRLCRRHCGQANDPYRERSEHMTNDRGRGAH